MRGAARSAIRIDGSPRPVRFHDDRARADGAAAHGDGGRRRGGGPGGVGPRGLRPRRAAGRGGRGPDGRGAGPVRARRRRAGGRGLARSGRAALPVRRRGLRRLLVAAHRSRGAAGAQAPDRRGRADPRRRRGRGGRRRRARSCPRRASAPPSGWRSRTAGPGTAGCARTTSSPSTPASSPTRALASLIADARFPGAEEVVLRCSAATGERLVRVLPEDAAAAADLPADVVRGPGRVADRGGRRPAAAGVGPLVLPDPPRRRRGAGRHRGAGGRRRRRSGDGRGRLRGCRAVLRVPARDGAGRRRRELGLLVPRRQGQPGAPGRRRSSASTWPAGARSRPPS